MSEKPHTCESCGVNELVPRRPSVRIIDGVATCTTCEVGA